MRWNPHFFRREGVNKGYDSNYLEALVRQGNLSSGERLPVIFSLSHLANLSKTLYSDLHGFVSREDIFRENFPYKNFTIGKRSGGRRWISVPVPPLMAVQKWISQNIVNSVLPHPAAFAYVRNRRILDHAYRHCGADWMLKIDIKDFFGNISERQVFNVFLSLKYTRLLSFEMARLCTKASPNRQGERWCNVDLDYSVSGYSSKFIGSLPQGAPTSPGLSNLVFSPIDHQLSELAQAESAVYSRYADDLCFSFTGSSRSAAVKMKRAVAEILWNAGFSENLKKTRIIPPGARKILTGLNVNDSTPTIPREVRNLVRMHLHYARVNGIPQHCRERGFRSVIGFRNYLLGVIGYVASINDQAGKKFLYQFNELNWIDFGL
ncbi:reverse transcriptase family protein [Achromobacter deleyi]|uniref:reverse transcriptase family protein n=1 Tax=Achromobacter deleyi TaxID=1353891 RepID=UPI0014678E82|nr:reverse transcriptase family protein [Achromobacter deleyi]CAB3913708.1 hypothetical protein LMG3412_04880 [Achromobacter deleyi]